MYLMKTEDGSYTLKKVSASGVPTKSAHPCRFSPDDKFSRHRVILKKRFGLLLLTGLFSKLIVRRASSEQYEILRAMSAQPFWCRGSRAKESIIGTRLKRMAALYEVKNPGDVSN